MKSSKVVRALYAVVTVTFVLVALAVLSLVVVGIVQQIRRPDLQSVELFIPGFSGFALILVVLGLLRRFARPIARGDDPFTATSVRRIRQLAFVVLLGEPFVDLLSKGSLALATHPSQFLVRLVVGLPAELASPLVMGLTLLLFAEAFARGVRLRDEVDSTI